ncbi:hypothetical protein NYE76_09875 [Paenibacillus sp. FSL M7-0831]|nr:hypothetical protein [Paenibacillus macerans]
MKSALGRRLRERPAGGPSAVGLRSSAIKIAAFNVLIIRALAD